MEIQISTAGITSLRPTFITPSGTAADKYIASANIVVAERCGISVVALSQRPQISPLTNTMPCLTSLSLSIVASAPGLHVFGHSGASMTTFS